MLESYAWLSLTCSAYKIFAPKTIQSFYVKIVS